MFSCGRLPPPTFCNVFKQVRVRSISASENRETLSWRRQLHSTRVVGSRCLVARQRNRCATARRLNDGDAALLSCTGNRSQCPGMSVGALWEQPPSDTLGQHRFPALFPSQQDQSAINAGKEQTQLADAKHNVTKTSVIRPSDALPLRTRAFSSFRESANVTDTSALLINPVDSAWDSMFLFFCDGLRIYLTRCRSGFYGSQHPSRTRPRVARHSSFDKTEGRYWTSVKESQNRRFLLQVGGSLAPHVYPQTTPHPSQSFFSIVLSFGIVLFVQLRHHFVHILFTSAALFGCSSFRLQQHL